MQELKGDSTLNETMNRMNRSVRFTSARLLLVGISVASAPLGATPLSPEEQASQPVPVAQGVPATVTPHGWGEEAASRMNWADLVESAPDPLVVTDATMRSQIQATGLPWRVRDRVSGIEMLLVPAGKYTMGMSVGDADATSDERPSHEVILTRPFYLGRTEVTQEQWTRLMGSNQSYFQDINFQVIPQADRTAKIAELLEAGYTSQQAEAKLGVAIMEVVVTATWPVETLTWEEVQPFLAKCGLRLPSEAEWEYACRAGSAAPCHGALDQIAWHAGNSVGRTHPVGSKSPNGLGFYDMIGNVLEWTNDWYGADYYKSCENGATDPTGNARNPFRVLRGGSWDHDGKNCRASFRLNHFTGDPRITDYGFRVARTP